jgi:hypothetical protein
MNPKKDGGSAGIYVSKKRGLGKGVKDGSCSHIFIQFVNPNSHGLDAQLSIPCSVKCFLSPLMPVQSSVGLVPV